jgi:actin-related protein
MTKFIEVSLEGGAHIDRYKLVDISVDDFIDTMLKLDPSSVKDITEEEYEKHRKFELDFNVEDRFECQHYIFKHVSREARNDWNRFIRQQRRMENWGI